ncbi:MAG: hypothetical protein KJO55_03040 [Gammaproteobacteria bacterium]|nr:hypothetical protein [Gammaproteobacteria bacterium]NND61331.1 hypothetical protein [Gammaproteobacteria bacterium]
MSDSTPSRGQLLRDVLVFQVKLFIDGFRDLVLSPISLIIALLDLVTGGDRFYRLMSLGRQTDFWIDLFGSHGDSGLDNAMTQIEDVVRSEYRDGKISRGALDAIKRALRNEAAPTDSETKAD